MIICLERGADLHMGQRMPLPLTVSWFSKIQIGFTFLVPAHPSSPGQRAVKRVCVCVCVLFLTIISLARSIAESVKRLRVCLPLSSSDVAWVLSRGKPSRGQRPFRPVCPVPTHLIVFLLFSCFNSCLFVC